MAQPTIIIQNDSGGRSGGSGSILGGLLPSKVWGIVGIILIALIALAIYSSLQWYSNYVDENCPESQGLIDVGFCAIEEETGVEDSGETGSQAFFSQLIWASPFGYIGAAIGIKTEGDTVGERIGNNFNRTKDNAFTLLKRLSGR